MYWSGSLIFLDVVVVSLSVVSEIDTGVRHVNATGLIDNFDSYHSAAEPFYQWDLSTSNKDEFITLDSLFALGYDNKYCAKMTYKADMAAATYSMDLAVDDGAFDSLSIWLKDASVKSSSSAFNYLDSVAAHAYIALSLTAGSVYYYDIAAVSKVWTNYVIPFSLFRLASGSETLTSASISKLTLAFSYVYYAQD